MAATQLGNRTGKWGNLGVVAGYSVFRGMQNQGSALGVRGSCPGWWVARKGHVLPGQCSWVACLRLGAGALGANIHWVIGESERPACEDHGFSLDGTGSQGMIQMRRVTVKFVSTLRGSICDDETSVAKRVPRTVADRVRGDEAGAGVTGYSVTWS